MSVATHGTVLTPAGHAATGASTLGEMVLRTAARHTGTALRHRLGGGWRDIDYAELGRTAREIAGGLLSLGIAPRDKIAILSSTRAEWTLVDCGAHCAGATVVPVYHTNSPEECRYVLGHSDTRLVFCEDAEQLAKVEAVRAELPALEHVVTFDGSGGLSLEALRARGAAADPAAVERTVAAVAPDDIATIIYTSGTTGPPKGCLTTHRNVMATVAMYEQQLDLESGVVFLFLPLAHSLARVTQMVVLDLGGTLAFWRGDAKLVLEDIVEIGPTHVPSVPRVFEKIHTKALAKADEGGKLTSLVFRWAVGVGRRVRELEHEGRAVPTVLAGEHRIADRLVLSKVRDLFGGRLELALTGAAPIAREVLDFFDACGVTILEGYGMTETTAAATLNTVDELRLGTVGRPLPGSEVSLTQDGEILMRGPHIFAGYHKNPDATRETMTEDGWLRSGDLGEIDADGYVRVTGRKKDLIITSSGKNITPTNIEAAIRESRWISQAVVFGDSRPYLVALLTLDPDEAPALAERCGVVPDLASMARAPEVRAVLQQELDQVNRRFARIEQVKRFVILDHDLTQETGELTPTAKLKRNVVYDRYRDVLAGLYEEA
ncbi:MAG TPA: long-chain fatty acid--CoA ligase [Baekduia sp.]|nr:long-chain fatty acid--CoA ligase [Baekduia sp.]